MSRTRMATSSASAAARPQANNRLHVVASETSCEDCPLWTTASGLPLCAECGSVAGLARFLRLLKETEHFRRWPQEEVAKIVHCGEQFYS
jgi:hypothetical protein